MILAARRRRPRGGRARTCCCRTGTGVPGRGRCTPPGRSWPGLALLLFALFWTPPGPFLPSLFFYVFGLAAVAGGVLTITSRNPIYSALWFASVVLATSGLFLLAGAPVPGGGDGHRLRRGDHRHVPVRDHAGPDGRPGDLRPRGAGAGPATFDAASCSSGACSTRCLADQAARVGRDRADADGRRRDGSPHATQRVA